MKKVLGLCLAICLSSSTLFAADQQTDNRKNANRMARCEYLIKELKLNDKQAAEFREIHQDFSRKMLEERQEMKEERKKSNEDRRKAREEFREIRKEKNDELKKILTKEQFQQYQQLMNKRMNQNSRGNRR